MKPGLGYAIGGYLAGIVGGGLATSAWSAVQGSNRLSLGLLAAGLAGIWTGYLATIALATRRSLSHPGDKPPPRGAPKSAPTSARPGFRIALPNDAVLGIAAGAAASIVLVPVVYTALRAVGLIDADDVHRLAGPAEKLADAVGRGGPKFAVLVLLVGVGAPIVEECFYRGLVQPAATQTFGARAGVAITAAFFALAHLEPLQFPGLFAFGLVVGTLAYRTGRLGPGIVAHMVFNGLTLARLAHLGG
ncbi:MAG: protease family protein [Actinomycetota bacterium]|jgi:membrane protease YdiL (CAAX protease family)|nr:protease family protein [Actinomycetota bacterium]